MDVCTRLRTSLRSKLTDLYEFVKSVTLEFYKDNGFILSSSLVYSTLMSLVPFFAVVTALFAAFGGVDILKTDFAEQLRLFEAPMQEKIIGLIEQFVSNARSLGVFGVISFLVTSVFLMNKISAVFNSIFRSTSQRPQFRQFAGYVTNLVIGTLFISLSISISTVAKTFLPRILDIGDINGFLFLTVPVLIVFSALLLLIKTLPATKVRYRSAALGAVVGTVCWQVVSLVFRNTSLFFTQNTTIYGSFAFLFLFLLWIYCLWVAILISAETAYVHQYGVYLTRKRREDSPAYIISLTFAVLAAVCEKFKSGNGICTFNEICARLQVPDRDVSKAADLLENRRFLIRADSMNRGYIPARMINDISMEEFVRSVYGEAAGKGCRSVSIVVCCRLAEGLNKIRKTDALKHPQAIPFQSASADQYKPIKRKNAKPLIVSLSKSQSISKNADSF